MTLIKPDPPPAATQAFREGLRAFLAGPEFGNVGKVVDVANLSAQSPPRESDLYTPGGPLEHHPQHVFTLGINDLKNGAGIAAARPVAWRFFAGAVPGKVVLGNCSQRAGDAWKLTSVFYGTRVSTALIQSEELGRLPEVEAADYELRFLRIPGLNLEAFWLVRRTAPTDLVAVFPAPPHQLHTSLNVSRVIPMSAFLDIVVPLARQRLTAPLAGS